MSSPPIDELARAKAYASRHGLVIQRKLGAGVDGIVLSTTRRSAVKALLRPENYRNERDAYLRLWDRGVDLLAGFHVPKLINFDDELLVVEMEIVDPPFVVDFAGAYIDRRPPFTEEELEVWMQDRSELFEEDWPRVRQLLFALRGLGIFMNDVKPGNITLRHAIE